MRAVLINFAVNLNYSRGHLYKCFIQKDPGRFSCVFAPMLVSLRGDDGAIASGYGVSSNFLSCMFSVTGLPNLSETYKRDKARQSHFSIALTEYGLGMYKIKIEINPQELVMIS